MIHPNEGTEQMEDDRERRLERLFSRAVIAQIGLKWFFIEGVYRDVKGKPYIVMWDKEQSHMEAVDAELSQFLDSSASPLKLFSLKEIYSSIKEQEKKC